ncbi:MAG: hypothetical protein IJC38_07800 [Erysipelotrichaceae bacterium]|nr:hypothetical protein [Erysipelotrichaceae bacterium]
MKKVRLNCYCQTIQEIVYQERRKMCGFGNDFDADHCWSGGCKGIDF